MMIHDHLLLNSICDNLDSKKSNTFLQNFCNGSGSRVPSVRYGNTVTNYQE